MKHLKFSAICKQELFKKSINATIVAFGVVTVLFPQNIKCITGLCFLVFVCSILVEYRNQKNAGKIDHIVDKTEAFKTHYALKKTYGIYDTDHCVFIYRRNDCGWYLFAIGSLYKDPLNGYIAPLYLLPIHYFDPQKRILHLSDDDLSNIDYHNLFVSRWLLPLNN